MLHPNTPLPYSVEYAKSARSTCKKCKKYINIEQLRMSLHQPSIFFDGTMDSWFHFECFWQNLAHGRHEINISSIKGVDWLRWEDQERLRDRVQKFRDPHFPPKLYFNTVSLSALKTDKSATNRGKCVKCGVNFEKDEIKVIHKSKNLHFKCHLEGFEKVEGTLNDVPGWSDYEDCWKNRVSESCLEIMKAKGPAEPNQPKVVLVVDGIEEGNLETTPDSASKVTTTIQASTTASSVVLDDDKLPLPDVPSTSIAGQKRHAEPEIIIQDEEETDASKKRRLARETKKAELQKARMKKQADQLWACRQLFEKLSGSERLAVLQINGQDIPEGQDPTALVIDRLADNATFGAPIGCQKCKNGKVVYNSSRRTYTCTGYATEYSKCTFETKNPIRTPFKTTPRLLEKCQGSVLFNVMCERLYIDVEEAEEVVKVDRRKSKGGVSGEQFIYAAEAFDMNNHVPIKINDLTSTNTHIIKNGTVVDAKFRYADRCHVYRSEVDGALYQATLSFTDLTQNKNSFYKIQLLKDDTREIYYVFRSWGRVGTEVGGFMDDSFAKEAAIQKFEEIFLEKTKNEWMFRKHFRKMPGAFSFVETDYSEFDQLKEQDIIPGSRTLLPRAVKEIVMSIFDIENMKSALKSFEMDVNKMPLGRLSHKQINQAFAVLNDLSDLLIDVPVDEDRILDCTNKFYTIIPHNFGMKVPEPIDSFHKIKEKNNMLNALLEIKFAYDQICGGDSTPTVTIGIDPVDVNYQKLKCKMNPIEKGCNEWKMIQEYITNTKGSTHNIKVELMDILMVDRENESNKFKRHIGNRKLLWHGSGKMNFAGILGQGLRIAPPEAPVSGYMFGKGVYFADMFSKSFFYCRVNASKDEAYLLLCDVALGNMAEKMDAVSVTKNTLPKGTSSVKGIGRECPNPIGDYNHADGYVVPKGPTHVQLTGKHGTDFRLLYNEYIVYDVDQVQLKYLVRVKCLQACHHY